MKEFRAVGIASGGPLSLGSSGGSPRTRTERGNGRMGQQPADAQATGRPVQHPQDLFGDRAYDSGRYTWSTWPGWAPKPLSPSETPGMPRFFGPVVMREPLHCGSLAHGLQSPPAAQSAGLDDAGSVRGTVPWTSASVGPSGFGYASPSRTHGQSVGLTLIQVGTEIRGRSPPEATSRRASSPAAYVAGRLTSSPWRP